MNEKRRNENPVSRFALKQNRIRFDLSSGRRIKRISTSSTQLDFLHNIKIEFLAFYYFLSFSFLFFIFFFHLLFLIPSLYLLKISAAGYISNNFKTYFILFNICKSLSRLINIFTHNLFFFFLNDFPIILSFWKKKSNQHSDF